MTQGQDASEPLSPTILLLLTLSLALSLVTLTHQLTVYAAAYLSAPHELSTFLSTIDSTIQENESYDRDITALARIEDRMRLARLHREIQRCGDDLREAINTVVVADVANVSVDGGGVSVAGVVPDGGKLRGGARMLWASKRVALREQVARLDMLRMRFLVVYMGLLAAQQQQQQQQQQNTGTSANTNITSTVFTRDPEKIDYSRGAAAKSVPTKRPVLPHALTENIARKPPLRNLSTQSMGHHENVDQPRRLGWAGVVQELQKSPLMHKRHASIETAMKSPFEALNSLSTS